MFRIAVFVYNYLYTNTNKVCALNSLAEAGAEVDLFLYYPVHEEQTPTLHDNVRVIRLTHPPDHPHVRVSFEDYVPKNVRESILTETAVQPYDYCIGVDAAGLMMAWYAALASGCPYAYKSTELNRVGDPGGHWSHQEITILKKFESVLIPDCGVFMIQDQAREDSFFDNLGEQFRPQEILHFPVSVPDKEAPEKRYWHKKFDLPDDKKVLLYLGGIDKAYMNTAHLKALNEVPDDYVVIMHGSAYEPFVKPRQQYFNGKKVIISSELVDCDEIPSLVASADISLIFYYEYNVNCYLTGRSSNKMAYYAQAGIPVICPNFSTFREVIDTYGNGRYFSYAEDISKLVREIEADKEACQQGARKAFTEVYDIDVHTKKLLEYVAAANRQAGLSAAEIAVEVQELNNKLELSVNALEEPVVASYIAAHVAYTWEMLSKFNNNLALFGGGQHTRWLLGLIKKNKLTMPSVIYDENPAGDNLAGVPVKKPGNEPSDQTIVLSTDCRQVLFSQRCSELFDAPNIIDLYKSFPVGPYPKSQSLQEEIS